MGTNRIVLIILMILLFPSMVNAIEVLPKGEFNCSHNLDGQKNTCTLYSNGKGLIFFDGDCTQIDDEVSFVKNNKCSHNRNGVENYICTESNTTCYVSIFANGASTTSCKNNINNSYASSPQNMDNLIQKAKSGKCMPEL